MDVSQAPSAVQDSSAEPTAVVSDIQPGTATFYALRLAGATLRFNKTGTLEIYDPYHENLTAAFRSWTCREDSLMIQLLLQGNNMETVSSHLKRTPAEIDNRVKVIRTRSNADVCLITPTTMRVGELLLPNVDKWSLAEDSVLFLMHKEGATLDKISVILGRPLQQIMDRLRRFPAGVPRGASMEEARVIYLESRILQLSIQHSAATEKP